MKLIKYMTVVVCALAVLALSARAEEKTCCEKATAAGKECTHQCCVDAKKAGKTCEKCNPPKKEEKKCQ